MAPPFPVFNRRDQAICTVEEWGRLAAPAAKAHWQPGRSACELARTWTSDAGLNALRSVLDPVDAIRNLRVRRGIAEARTRFDAYGGPRQHDLLLNGEADGGEIVVAIEGKVNESFGRKLSGYRRAALRRVERGEETNAPERLDGLTEALAGWTLSDPAGEAGAALRYQLFSAVAGTIAQARLDGAGLAVFCVHELDTPLSADRARAANACDLDEFMAALYPAARRSATHLGWIAGPVAVARPTSRLSARVVLYIAKLRTPTV